MGQFINDMVHMTEGEKLIQYWWLWLLIVGGIFLYLNIKSK